MHILKGNIKKGYIILMGRMEGKVILISKGKERFVPEDSRNVLSTATIGTLSSGRKSYFSS